MSNKQINTFNVAFDLGHLLVNDTQPFSKPEIFEEDITERALNNLKSFYDEIYKVCATQRGQEDEKRDFDKAEDNVELPKPTTVLPRAKPVPKAKPLTKWERYRLEKGMPPKKKKSRMVYSELADDWVPRWGKGR
jgi:regulator of ribosome biosynthesis